MNIKFNNKTLWTKKEIAYLIRHYATEETIIIGNKLHKNKEAVVRKANKLGLKKLPLWTLEEKIFFQKNYSHYGAKKIAQKLNKTPSACRCMAKKMNLKYINKNMWTKEQLDLLKTYYPLLGKYCYTLIPNKTLKACLSKALKMKITYEKNTSSAVEKIKQYLLNNNITFRQEIYFKECKDKQYLLFDFAIYDTNNLNNLLGLIEYDGMQHFIPTLCYSNYKNATLTLQITKKHDLIKNNFCKINKIPLLRIKYTQDNIEEILNIFINNPLEFLTKYNPFLSNKKYYEDIYNSEELKRIIHFSKYPKNNKTSLNCIVTKWTYEDDLFLEKYYPTKGSKWTAKNLHRSPSSCINRANRLGLHHKRYFTKQEDAFIIKNYSLKQTKYIAKKLNRTISSINHRANRLNIHKNKLTI